MHTSDIKTHGIPPIPNEKDPVKTWKQNHDRLVDSVFTFSC